MRFELFYSLIWRNLIQNSTRNILTIIGISLGIAVFLSIQLLNHSALESFSDNVRFLKQKYNLEIVSKTQPTFDESVLSNLTKLWHYGASYTPVISQTVEFGSAKPATTSEIINLYGTDLLNENNFSGLQYTSNQKREAPLDIFKPNHIYISDSFALKHHLVVGSEFNILLPETVQKLIVSGIYRPISNGSTYSQNWLIGDISVVQDILDKPKRISQIQISVPAEKMTSIKTLINQNIGLDLVLQSPKEHQSQLENMLSAFHTNLQALSLVSLLVGMFLIYNTISISVLRRRKEIGTLRTLGASNLEISALFIVETLILGIMGILLGLLVGILISYIGLTSMSLTLEKVYGLAPIQELDINLAVLFFSILIGFITLFIGLIPPLIEALCVSPALVSRPNEENTRHATLLKPLIFVSVLLFSFAWLTSKFPSYNHIPIGGYAASFLLMLGFSSTTPIIIMLCAQGIRRTILKFQFWQIHIAILNIERALVKSSVAIASLMVSVALIVSIVTMVGSFRTTVTNWVEQTLKADIFIEPRIKTESKLGLGLSSEAVEKLRKIPQVLAVDDFIEQPILYKGLRTNLGAGNPDTLLKYGNLRFTDNMTPQETLGSMLKSNYNIIVSESFSNRFHVRKNDTIKLSSPDGYLSLHIVGVYYDYSSELGYIIMSKAFYRKCYHDNSTSNIAIYIRPGISTEKIRQIITKKLGLNTPLVIRTNKELREEVLRIFDNTFSITRVLLFVSIFISALSVTISLLTMVSELETDFTLMRYLGSSVSDIRQIILCQAAWVGLLGASMGILNGYLLSLLLIFVINKQAFHWTIEFQWHWFTITELFVAIFLGSLIAGFLSSLTHKTTLNSESLRHA